MPIQTPTDPRFGSRLSASEFRNRVTNPLVANDTSLESRLTALEFALAALPQEYRQANIPTTARFKDHWIDPSDNEQLYFCVETYGEGEADKVHKWVAIGDSTARATAQTAVTTAGQATRIIIDDEPPVSCERGWTWTDTSASNRDMRCMTSYAETDGPDGYPSLDAFRRSRFAPTDSHIGSLLAAAEQGLKDGKSNTLFQADVPASADGRDIWVDTDNNNGTFACFASYRTTDHDPYDSLKTYVAGEIVTYLGNMYQAKSGGSPAGNVPSNVMYWLLLGTAYANQTLFRESRWTPISDSVARSMAQAAQGIADGKTTNFYQPDYPTGADFKDSFINSVTNQAYICIQAYNADTVLPEDRHEMWEAIADTVARDAAEAKDAIADGIINTYLQATIPASAGVKDIWFNTAEQYQAYVCIADYAVGGDMTFWKPMTDKSKTATYQTPTMPTKANLGDSWIKSNEKQYICLATYAEGTGILAVNWQPVNDTFRAVYYLPNPPTSAQQGDGWLDTETPENQYQFYICNEDYTNGAHGWTSLASPGKWTPSRDTGAMTTATLALDVANEAKQAVIDAQAAIADSVIQTFLQPTLPASASIKDLWFNSAQKYQGYVCITSYTEGGDLSHWKALTDTSKTTTHQVPTMPDSANIGDTWVQSNEKQFICLQTYSAGAGILAVNWQPIADTFRAVYYLPDPPVAAQQGDGWLDTFTPDGQYQFYICNENYANNEHGWTSPASSGKWTPSRDVNSQATATLALNTANGKTTTYYQNEMPDSAKRGDQWVDTNNPYLDTGLFVTYLCIDPYTSGTGSLNGNWTEYADPVAMKTAQDAMAIADGKRKIVYNASVPRADDYGGFDLGDGWMDSDDFKFYICKTPHTTGTNIDHWQESTNSQAEQAMQIALDAQAVQDGVRQTYTTAGAGDLFWPGPGGANQWPISNWATAGAKVGDVWFHKNTTNGVYSLRHCIVAYSGFADGSMGSLANWATFTDPDMERNFQDSIDLVNQDITDLADATTTGLNAKMDKAGGEFTGAVGFIPSQTFAGSSMELAGGATVNGALSAMLEPAAPNHVVRRVELDALASTAATAIGTAQSTADTAVTNAATAQSTANTAVENAATAQDAADQAQLDANIGKNYVEAIQESQKQMFFYIDNTIGLDGTTVDGTPTFENLAAITLLGADPATKPLNMMAFNQVLGNDEYSAMYHVRGDYWKNKNIVFVFRNNGNHGLGIYAPGAVNIDCKTLTLRSAVDTALDVEILIGAGLNYITITGDVFFESPIKPSTIGLYFLEIIGNVVGVGDVTTRLSGIYAKVSGEVKAKNLYLFGVGGIKAICTNLTLRSYCLNVDAFVHKEVTSLGAAVFTSNITCDTLTMNSSDLTFASSKILIQTGTVDIKSLYLQEGSFWRSWSSTYTSGSGLTHDSSSVYFGIYTGNGMPVTAN